MDPNPPANDPTAADQATAAATINKQDRTMAIVCHLLGLVTTGTVIAPLIVWLIMRGSSPFVDFHGKQAVNLNLTVLICYMMSFALYSIFCLGPVVAVATFVVHIIFAIVASIKSAQGVYYVIPAAIPLVR